MATVCCLEVIAQFADFLTEHILVHGKAGRGFQG